MKTSRRGLAAVMMAFMFAAGGCSLTGNKPTPAPERTKMRNTRPKTRKELRKFNKDMKRAPKGIESNP